MEYHHTQRETLPWLGGGIAVGSASWITGGVARAAGLPLQNTGLEHFGMTVPDPEESAKFYGRIFDPQLFREKDPPPRFYSKLGTGYVAFGGNKDVTSASIDHFCVLVDGYGQGEARKVLEAAGLPMGNGPL